MVIAGPRSGTAWAANWLTTEKTLCWHDPLFTVALDALDSVQDDARPLGIADTGIWNFLDYLRGHPARKVVLHRKTSEINDSLRAAGLPAMAPGFEQSLACIEGLHVPWRHLFDAPDVIHEYLFGTEPDWRRHALLKTLNVQADFEKINPDPHVTRRMLQRMRGERA